MCLGMYRVDPEIKILGGKVEAIKVLPISMKSSGPFSSIVDRRALFPQQWKSEGDRMTVQTFRNLLTERPFKPFRLVMSSGMAYEVRHPEMALLTKTDILVGIDIEDDGVPAEFKICSMLHVTAVEPLEPTANGDQG